MSTDPKSNSDATEGCAAVAGSRFADTPECNALWEGGWNHTRLWELSQKLERERDEAQSDLARYVEGFQKIEEERDQLRAAIRNLRDVSGRHHSQIACERLFALLPENVNVDLPDTAAQVSASKSNSPAVSG